MPYRDRFLDRFPNLKQLNHICYHSLHNAAPVLLLGNGLMLLLSVVQRDWDEAQAWSWGLLLVVGIWLNDNEEHKNTTHL